MRNHLYEDKGGILHKCEGGRCVGIDRQTYVVWTKCGEDVPANKSFKSAEKASCARCNEA